MNATPRVHFEEIDWLDYVQDDLEPDAKKQLSAHHAECVRCQETVASLERLSRAIPSALHLVDDGADPDVDAIAAAARGRADEVLAGEDDRRAVLRTAFSAAGAPGAPRFEWTAELLDEAPSLCREALRTDAALAGRIARSALAAVESGALPADAWLAGSLRASLAYVAIGEGRVGDALRDLDDVRAALETAPVPEIELGFWRYVRATALYNSDRAAEALDEIRSARAIYEMLEDPDRLARCRQVEAVLVSDLGRHAEAVELYREILRDSRLGEDRVVHATLLVNYAGGLVRVGQLDEARRVYVRASALLKSTGETGHLIRIRSGLAMIAEAEGRLEEALAIRMELRPEFHAHPIPWSEIQSELGIAELLVRLDRGAEAAAICRGLLPRAEALGFEREGARALACLAEAETPVDLHQIDRVRRFLRRLESGEDVRWSAA